jgi:hypothetical protein
VIAFLVVLPQHVRAEVVFGVAVNGVDVVRVVLRIVVLDEQIRAVDAVVGFPSPSRFCSGMVIKLLAPQEEKTDS